MTNTTVGEQKTREDKDLIFEKGTEWYFVSDGKIRKCQYLCLFPFNNPTNVGEYDIVIWKDLDNPERIHRKTLLELIERNKHILNYEDAKKDLIKQTEELLTSIKIMPISNQSKY